MLGKCDILRMSGVFTARLLDSKTGRVTREVQAPNLITQAGKNLVTRMLLDVSSYDLGLTYQALGTGAKIPRVRDTQLEAESVRRIVTTREDTSGQISAFTTFFPALVVPSSIGEVGIFGHDASENLNTGILFARALLSISGASGEDLLVTYILTVS